MAEEYKTTDMSSTEAAPEKAASDSKSSSELFVDYQSLPTSDNDCEPVEAESIPLVVECPTCEPNPSAPNIDWTKKSDTEPFLNQRKCTYSITLTTKYEGTGGPTTLQKRLNEYVDEGVLKLLAHFNKALDATTIKAATKMAGATDHFIPPRAKLKMKVLIELPANEFDMLPNAVDIPEVADSVAEKAEELGLKPASSSATIDFGLFDQQMDKLTEGLKVYAKFQAIFYQTQRGTVRFPGGAPVNLQAEADYLRTLRPALYEWLRTKGWVMRNVRGKSNRSQPKGKGLKECEKLEFGFCDDYKLTSITLYPHGTCAEDPTVIDGMKVFSLSNMEPFNRPTTMNWLTNIEDAEIALLQRQGMMKWTEFAEKFVYPTPKINQAVDITSTVSAIASAAVGQATNKDIDTIHKSAVAMTDTEKIEAKTPGSWGNYPQGRGTSGRDPEAANNSGLGGKSITGHANKVARQDKTTIPGTDEFQERGYGTTYSDVASALTSPPNEDYAKWKLAGGGDTAYSEAKSNDETWPMASSDPNDPTYRGPQKIWDPTLKNGKGGYRMETAQEALNRSNRALADQSNGLLVTSGDVIEGLCDGPPNFFEDFGEDFMKELFSIWDAIQYQFHNFICMTPEQRQQMLENFRNANAEASATAFREAMRILVGFLEMISSLQYSLQEVRDMKGLYVQALDEITFCGLFDLMSAMIDCLAQGFDLEELLEPLIVVALSKLPAVEFGKLFVGLPPEDQAAVLAKVQGELGSHVLPWEAVEIIKSSPNGSAKDPAAESPFGNRAMEGVNVNMSGGKLSVEKREAKQDPTLVTPALQALVKGLEEGLEEKRIALQREAEEIADGLIRAERAVLATRDSDGDGISDLEEAEARGTIATEEQLDKDDGIFEGVGGGTFTYAESEPVPEADVFTAFLGESSTASTLADYFKDYEMEGYEGVTASNISSSPADYITALQDLFDRVNSASSIVASTEVKVDQFSEETPAKSPQWKAYYYEEYNKAMKEYKDKNHTYGPCSEDINSAACDEEAHTYSDSVARTQADFRDEADKGRLGDPGPFGTRGSLGAALGSTVSTAISAYIRALVEHYRDVGLEKLMDALENTKGGQIIAKIIALIDCVLPPLFDPPLLDFLNSLQIDFCNMVVRMTGPGLPKLAMPNWKDFFKYLLELLKEIVEYILWRLLIWLLTKIVLMLFDSLCAALEKLADAAMGALADAACAMLPDEISEAYQDAGQCADPPRNMLDMMKEAFCGPNATDEQAAKAAADAMRAMAPVTEADAARMANEDAVNQLVADVSAVLTGDELSNLLLGEHDPVACRMVQELVQSSNPEFASLMGSPQQIAHMFENMGHLLPADLKNRLRATRAEIPAVRPANPLLCKTQDDVMRFKEMRRQILMAKDGTTQSQADQQFDAMRGRALNDITQMTDIMQGGVEAFLSENMPPLIGEPDENGCIPPNAVIPREPDELMEVLEAANDSLFDNVDRAFDRDVIGRKGCLSYVLSDINGLPWTRHQRKSRRRLIYSDYQGELAQMLGLEGVTLPDTHPFKSLIDRETGFYPTYVGQYFKEYLDEGKHNPDGYVSTVEYTEGEYEFYPEEGIVGSIIPAGSFPTLYNGVSIGTEENPFYTPGQKQPDLTLQFRDNNHGIHPDWIPDNMKFSDGFNIDYFSHVVEEDDEGNQIVNTDNVFQIAISDVTNPLSWTPGGLSGINDNPFADLDFDIDEGMVEERFMITVTGSLSEGAESIRSTFDLSKDPTQSPQINCFDQFILQKISALGLTQEQMDYYYQIKPFTGIEDDENAGSVTHDNIMNTLLDYMGRAIAGNNPAYSFGFEAGTDDDLDSIDKMYMSPNGDKPFIKYVLEDLADELGDKYKIKLPNTATTAGMTIPNVRKLRKYVKNNQIMGTSNHSRMHFLNPSEFGGSWFKPPYYIQPPTYEGWLGIRDALVPEVDGKEPKRIPVCNFKDIKERVEELTKKMPDDPRLSECPDCVQELPYSRILDRASAAGMEGPIFGIIRIYALEEMLKAVPVFTKFKAKIPEVLDYTYVEYILANMKEDFTERLGRKRGFLKGDALWYTFLEQCVQSFCRQIQLDGREVTPEVQEAIDALNEMQEGFKYPTEEDWQQARRRGGLNPWAQFGLEDTEMQDLDPEIVFDREVNRFTKLKWYRRWHLLQAVRQTEHHANTIMRVLIEEQLEYMARQFEESQSAIGMAPDISNIYEFFIGSSGFVAGTQNYSLDKDAMPSETEPQIFDVAELWTTRAEDIEIRTALDRKSVLRNPLEQYETSTKKLDVEAVLQTEQGKYTAQEEEYHSRFKTGEFYLEKYIRIIDKDELGLSDELPENIVDRPEHLYGVVNIKDWKNWLQSAQVAVHHDRRLSEFFGNLEFTYATDQEGNLTNEITGIDGEMGVRYGLRLCYVPPHSRHEEIGAFWEGTADKEGLKQGENWNLIKSNALKEKAFYLDAAEINQEGLNITNHILMFGDTKVPASTINEITSLTHEQHLNEIYVDGKDTRGGVFTMPSSKFIIPLVSAEYDALDHTLGQHLENIDSEMDLYCLGRDLIAQPEFEMLFQYVFPLNRLTSMMGIYTGMGFFSSIGEKVVQVDTSDTGALLNNGFPKPDNSAGEWQIYPLRRLMTRGGRSFDGWDFESLFPATKKSLVQMFRSYFKSREFLSHKDEEEDNESEKGRKSTRKNMKKKKKGKRGSRKMRSRRRDRPFDKFGE